MEAKWAKVFIIDDDPSFAVYMRFVISPQTNFCICGDAPDVRQALKLLPTCSPDLILLDLLLDDHHGLEVIKDIRAVDPRVRILIFSGHDEVVYAERAVRAGAQGFVMKTEAVQTRLEAMRHVMAGSIWLSPAMRTRVTQQWATSRPQDGVCGIERLSDRELEILHLLGEGRSNSQICAMLSLARHSVQTYQTRVREKLGLMNTHELIRYAALWAVSERSHHSLGRFGDRHDTTRHDTTRPRPLQLTLFEIQSLASPLLLSV
jgi:DNA-binding NarL/FixJ family response regulator